MNDASKTTPARNDGDVVGTRAHMSAASAEVGEFLQRFRGKSPQEMLGVIGQSGLVKATIQATLAMILLVIVFTVGPYFLSKWNKKHSASPAPKNGANPPETANPVTPTPSNTNAPPSTVDPSTKPDPSKPLTSSSVLDKIGETETKKANSKTNPLENKNDDLLKDLK